MSKHHISMETPKYHTECPKQHTEHPKHHTECPRHGLVEVVHVRIDGGFALSCKCKRKDLLCFECFWFHNQINRGSLRIGKWNPRCVCDICNEAM